MLSILVRNIILKWMIPYLFHNDFISSHPETIIFSDSLQKCNQQLLKKISASQHSSKKSQQMKNKTNLLTSKFYVSYFI